MLTSDPLEAAASLAAVEAGARSAVEELRRTLVALRYLPGAVEVEVDDRGGGAPGDGPRGTGLGLVGVRERLATVGGSVEAGTTGSGYRVLASVPLPQGPPGARVGAEPAAVVGS